jgi:hypothetical protein
MSIMFLGRNRIRKQREKRTLRRTVPSRMTIKPRLERLEDRTVPSIATHFEVVTPSFLVAGFPAPAAVMALDAANNLVFDYRGTAHFGSSDLAAQLPADYAFTDFDHGEHVFSITLQSPGMQTVSATDTANPSITGSATVTVNAAPVVTHFEVIVPQTIPAGVLVPVALIAQDGANEPVFNYAGTVHFMSSDSAATLPADFTFTATDHGIHVFSATFRTPGNQTITATDTANSSITGMAALDVHAMTSAATHFEVMAPPMAAAGIPFPLTVVAVDAMNDPAPSYLGTVHFESTDSAAALPADFTFTAMDHGFHVFPITLQTAGSQTMTVTDTSHSSITGSAAVTVVIPAVATHFGVLAPPTVPAGIPFPVGVVALDAANHPVFTYTGTVHFTSSDPAASLPADFTFTAFDHGVHIFPVSLQTAGTQTITVTDTSHSSITGSATVMVGTIGFGTATHFGVMAPPMVPAGIPFPVQVVALDASNDPVFNYTGTVHFTSSDLAAQLPADYTFTPFDHGFHVFPVSLQTAGSQTITVTDTAHSSITGSAPVTVGPQLDVVTHMAVLAPPVVPAGTAFPIAVVALDALDHPVPTYTGTVHFMSSDGAASLPADFTFTAADHGAQTFPVTLQTAGTQTITVTDTSHSSITGTATVMVVIPGVASHFAVLAPPRVPAGIPFPVHVVALDDANQPAFTYTGTVHFMSSDPGATLPADFTFTADDHGVHVFPVTLATEGSQMITVTDTSHSSITGSATVIVANPFGEVTHFGVLAPPAVQVGSAFPVGVVALDASDDPVPSYTGTVHFTSSDSAADLPADFTFTAGDHGVHLFPVSLQNVGSQTITVTDTSHSSITGSADVMVFSHIHIWLNQVYQNLLGRPLDPVGESCWTGALAQGATQTEVVQDIEASPEYRIRVIDNLYATLLGRAPDMLGLTNFLAAMNSGTTIEQVKSAILGSEEYFARAGSTNAGFVIALYHDTLGRPVDAAGAAGWIGLLKGGADRSVVASAVVTSGEADQLLVQQDYLAFLSRPVDAPSLSGWSNALQQGQRDEWIAAAIMGSSEFFQGL